MRLCKYHGLGNDYLVLEEGPAMTAALVRELCHRNTGPGGDGILEPADAGPCDAGVRIWNPDGSVAEKSGNGLRIYARWLVDTGRRSSPFSIWTGWCAVECVVGKGDIAVQMGVATVDPASVPVAMALVDAKIGEAGPVTAIGLGNPHCVVFCADPDAVDWRAAGARLEVDPRFPNRTNVQHAAVLGPGRVLARIWERGAGETLASGSSACAVAAAAVRTGRLQPGLITVQMAGGDLTVEVGSDLSLRLIGPVERVGHIMVDAAWLAKRGA